MFKKRFIFLPIIFLTLCLLLFPGSFQELIDCIVAIVNEQVITLTDLKILERFKIYEGELDRETGNPLFFLLAKVVNQKIVIDAAKENVFVEEYELEASFKEITERFRPEEFQRRMEEFGLDLEGLFEYLEEKILYQKILSRRFGNGISMNLEEVKKDRQQAGYRLNLVSQVELPVRQDRLKTIIVKWIKNLKKKANIEIKFENLRR
ncbi:MAG: hypothetical protein V3V63_04050 [Candidatus Hydrothermarchaeaceae archaeon]